MAMLTPMSAANKALICRWFEEVWNQQREATIDELLLPDCLIHGIAEGPVRGPAQFKQFWRGLVEAFPDVRVDVEETIAEGDKVLARCTVRGTHSGNGLNLQPTNRNITMTGMCLARIRDGRMADGWNNFDFHSLYQQLGAVS